MLCHFFYFYFFNKDISFTIQDITTKVSTFILKVLQERRVSQIFHLILSFHFMLNTGNFNVNFLYFLHFDFLKHN